MDEQILSFKDSWRVVMRYKRVAAVCAVVGLVGGLAYAITQPSLVSAKSLVLLPESAGNSAGVPTRAIGTEVQIATTPTILVTAAQTAGIKLPYSVLVRRVTVTGTTNDVLQIVAKGSTASEAESLANAVATTFKAYALTQTSLLSSGAVTEWTQEEQTYQSQLPDLQTQLSNDQRAAAAQPLGSQAAQQYKAVVLSDQASIGAIQEQIKNLKSDIALAQETQSSPASGAEILVHATTAISPSVLRIPMLGGIGLLIGLLIGAVAAFGVGRKDRRLRLRDEIARATGAPVLASLTKVRRSKSDNLIEILDHFEPSVLDKANLRRLLDDLGVERRVGHSNAPASQNGSSAHHENGSSAHHDGIGIHAIVLAGDHQAVAAAAELPAFAASLGMPVALVVAGSEASTEQLAIACAARDPLEANAPRPNLLTYASAPGRAPSGVALAVTLEVVDPATLDVADMEPIPDVPGRKESALLIVSSGFAKPEDLEVVALAAEHHGRPLVGIVVADPEPSDKTSGIQQPRRVIGPNGPRQIAALRSATR